MVSVSFLNFQHWQTLLSVLPIPWTITNIKTTKVKHYSYSYNSNWPPPQYSSDSRCCCWVTPWSDCCTLPLSCCVSSCWTCPQYGWLHPGSRDYRAVGRSCGLPNPGVPPRGPGPATGTVVQYLNVQGLPGQKTASQTLIVLVLLQVYLLL